jgi:uncharacterized protein YfaS (alpha-2-macroglobulin family)
MVCVSVRACDVCHTTQATYELTSAKMFNVEASLPRIARVDDRFLAGVSIASNLPPSQYPGA